MTEGDGGPPGVESEANLKAADRRSQPPVQLVSGDALHSAHTVSCDDAAAMLQLVEMLTF